MSASSRAVFLSHASQDAEVVARIAAALRASDIEVWFDRDELRGGDVWDAKIRKQIRECALFVPIVSANTQARAEGYFRLEWKLAEDRSYLMAKGRPFIVPVGIDGVAEGEALVPEGFLAAQWSRVDSDAALAAFAAQVQRLLSASSGGSGAAYAGGGSHGRTARASQALKPTIPDYELVRKIGEGGYGEVWLARGLTGAYRAVKIVWRNRFSEAEPFDREFRGLKESMRGAVGVSGSLALLHVGRDEAAGFFYYVMELADDAERGRTIDPARYVPLTLKEVRTRRGRLPVAECREVGLMLGRELAALHARGLVHRDIKPSNVILVNGAAKLADVGLVASVGDARTFVGTEGFVPPEGPGTPAADLFALGKVLYELVTGNDRQAFPQLPETFTDAQEREAYFKFNDVLLRACDPRPERRYAEASSLVTDLERLQAGRTVAGRRRRRVGMAVVAAAALVTAFLSWPRPAEPTAPRTDSAGTAPETSAPAEKSLVVLPLENLGADPADAVFTDGMHAEIIAALGGSADLKVISRHSALAVNQAGGRLPEIAGKLGVANVVTGSVRRAGEQFRIGIELRRARDETLLWTKTFDGKFDDVFAIQAGIADEVARVLQARERPGPAAAQLLTKNPRAYALLLQARHAAGQETRTFANIEKYIADLEQVIALDPDYFSAANALAVAHANAFRFNLDAASRTYHAARAKHWADTAARLMPGGAGDGALMAYYMEVEFDFVRAVAHAERALRSWPNDAGVMNGASYALSGLGRMADAVTLVRRAIAVDPLNRVTRENELDYLLRLRRIEAWRTAEAEYATVAGQWANRAAAATRRFMLTGEMPADLAGMSASSRLPWLWRARRFEESLLLVEAELAASHTNDRSRFELLGTKADLLGGLGRRTEAAAVAAEQIALAGKLNAGAMFDVSMKDYYLATALVRLGQADEAIAAGRRWVEARSATTAPVLRWDREVVLARIYARAGRSRECVELIARLLQVPGRLTVPLLRLDPDWDAVREDPGFKALLADPKNSAPL